MTEEPKHVERVLYCNNCGENLFKHGVIERTFGGTSETHFLFDTGDEPGVIFGDTFGYDCQGQETICQNCNKPFCDGEVTVCEIIDFYEGHTEYLESYLDFQGGAPVPSAQNPNR